MARILESLEPGTPVFAGATRVGTVSGVYAEGNARSAELVIVRWDAVQSDLAIPAGEIESVADDGVHLMRTDPSQFEDLAPFDPARFPTMKKLT